MCEIVDRYAQQVAEDAVKVAVEEVTKEKDMSMARKLFRAGMDYEFVSRCVEDLSTEELKVIYEEVVASR